MIICSLHVFKFLSISTPAVTSTTVSGVTQPQLGPGAVGPQVPASKPLFPSAQVGTFAGHIPAICLAFTCKYITVHQD